MNKNRLNDTRRINYLTSETDALYHLASVKLGISDSVSIVLYTLYDPDKSCLLSDIYKKSGVSKQTVNSALRKLEKDGILRLSNHSGKLKKVTLTEKGVAFAEKTVAKLLDAEIRALEDWSSDEINTYIALTEKYLECFGKQVREL